MVRSQTPCHPSVHPHAPQRRRRNETLQAGLKSSDAALEERGQAAAEVAGLARWDFFSSGVARWTASHMPVETAQKRASAMTRSRRPRRSERWMWLSSRPKPRVLKSENMASMPHLEPVVEGAVSGRRLGQGDDPGFGMARLVHHGDIRGHPLSGQLDAAEQVLAPREARRQGGLAAVLEHQEVPLEP